MERLWVGFHRICKPGMFWKTEELIRSLKWSRTNSGHFNDWIFLYSTDKKSETNKLGKPVTMQCRKIYAKHPPQISIDNLPISESPGSHPSFATAVKSQHWSRTTSRSASFLRGQFGQLWPFFDCYLCKKHKSSIAAKKFTRVKVPPPL